MGRRFYLGLGLLLLLLIGGLLLSAWVSRKISPLEQALTEAAGEAVTGDFSRAVTSNI